MAVRMADTTLLSPYLCFPDLSTNFSLQLNFFYLRSDFLLLSLQPSSHLSHPRTLSSCTCPSPFPFGPQFSTTLFPGAFRAAACRPDLSLETPL